jgi:hypothetical protein
MRLPFVSRDRYDELRAEYKDLFDKYHALKQQGAELPPVPKPALPSATVPSRARDHRRPR